LSYKTISASNRVGLRKSDAVTTYKAIAHMLSAAAVSAVAVASVKAAAVGSELVSPSPSPSQWRLLSQ